MAMFCVKALITTVIASAFVVARDRPSELTSELDSNGLPIDNTTFLRISENEMAFDTHQSIAERKGCSPKNSCSKAGGHCVKSRAACDGTIDAKGCKGGGGKCKCCIPDQTTPTPVACPTVTECPTTVPTTCPIVTPCPTTVLTTCPTVTECPTTAPTTYPIVTPCPTTVPTTCPIVTQCPTTAPTTCPIVTPCPTTVPITCPIVTQCPTTPPTTCPSCPTPVPTTCPIVTQCPTTAPTTCPPCPTTVPTTCPDVNPDLTTMITPVENCSTAGGISSIYDGVYYCTMTNWANWTTTREWCNDIGMALAQPDDPKGLAAYIRTLYSSNYWFWLGGKGDNTNQVWLNGTVISNTDPSWYSGSPNVQDNYCMALQTGHGYNTPLKTYTCDQSAGYRLCEASTTVPTTTTPTTGCPEGFFFLRETRQCFKIFLDAEISWQSARTKCQSEDLVLAKPYDAIALRGYIMERYGIRDEIWVDARSDGSKFVWQRDSKYLTSSNPLMYHSSSSYYTTSYCLGLATTESSWNSYPTKPYMPITCGTNEYPLCELIIPTGCPDGFFMTAGSLQCFKLFLDAEISWSSARTKCQSEDLVLAKPNAAIAVRDYIMQRYGLNDEIWVDARGTGSTFQWQRDSKYLSTSNPLMYTPDSSQYSSNYCLALATQQAQWTSYPTKPYNPVTCSTAEYPLCELIRG